MHGRGKFTWLDNSASHGNVYDGEWIYNIMHGKGKFTWANGVKFEGFYKKGKRLEGGKF